MSKGEGYFLDGRVTLSTVTPRAISATVRNRRINSVNLLDQGDEERSTYKVFCTCTHFKRRGICEHLWAAVLAADAAIDAARQQAEAESRRARKSMWRELLFPLRQASSADPNRWEGVPGEFMLRYELDIHEEAITLGAFKQKILKSGAFGKQSAPAPHKILEEHDLPETDRAILEILLREITDQVYAGHYWARSWHTRNFGHCMVSGAPLQWLLPELAGTGRCRVTIHDQIIADPLQRGQPYQAALEFLLLPESRSNQQQEFVYVPHVRIGETILPLEQIHLFLPTKPLAFILDQRLHVLPGPDDMWLINIRRNGNRIHVPKSDARELYLTANETPAAGALPLLDDVPRPALELPEELGPEPRLAIEPKPSLEVELGEEAITAQLWLDYDGFEITANDPRPAILDIGAWSRIERNPRAEEALLDQVRHCGLECRDTGLFLSPHTSPWQALEALAPLAAQGWNIRGRDKRRLLAGQATGLRVSSGLDWFDVEGGVDFGNAIVPLPKAIRAFLRGENSIELPDGSQGLLPTEWLERHAHLLEIGHSGLDRDDKLRFHSAHAMLLDSLLQEVEVQAMDQDFLKLRERIKSFAGVTSPPPPRGLNGALRPYQQEALGWFDFLANFGCGGVLADDMGLGKTVQVLSWLLLEKERGTGGPTLVVAPTSLLFNWREEAARFCPDLSVLSYAGLDRNGLEKAFGEHDLVLTTYGLLRRDIEILRQIRWRCLILDESQAIKNPASQTAKAARILEADRRLCMTGTPLENRLDELWSQFHFCNRNMLGSRMQFDTRFAKPLSQGEDKARELLQRVIRPFVLRRTKDAVAADLPDKQEAVIHCEMTEDQTAVYDRLRDHYRSEILAAVDTQGLNRSKIKVLEGLLRLRQVACHPELVGVAGSSSGKLEELIKTVLEVVAEGHKALVFSQFTKFLALIRQRLEAQGVAHAYLDGRTPAKEREKRVAAFQDPGGPPVFCISLKAGGVGLNLTAADYVFIMDPWWNPAVEAQAVDRTHRIGQDKKVFAYRLICTESIDEKVLLLQKGKKELATILEQGATSTLASLTREDLEALLS